jgi:hypothetical protein
MVVEREGTLWPAERIAGNLYEWRAQLGETAPRTTVHSWLCCTRLLREVTMTLHDS